jgi:D-sedoheptulose 7-phosphate isomerase
LTSIDLYWKLLQYRGMNYAHYWNESLLEAEEVLHHFRTSPEIMKQCEDFSRYLVAVYQAGGVVFSCGNGGSHCDAMHFAEELTGRYRKDRPPLGALALGDPSHVTCVSNDYGFSYIFSRQLEGLSRKGDLLLGLSTSGNSQNIIEAFLTAKKKGVTTIALLGRQGGHLKDLADLAIVVPAQTSDRIQEIHIKLIHTVIESVERVLFPHLYTSV